MARQRDVEAARRALMTAVKTYLEAIGWRVMGTGVPGVQPDPQNPFTFGYECVVKFEGGHQRPRRSHHARRAPPT